MNWNHSELGSLGIGITKNRESLGMRITMNRESLGIGVAVNWGRLDFVTLTYSSRRKPKRKRPARLVAWVLFPQKKNTAKRNHHAGLLFSVVWSV